MMIQTTKRHIISALLLTCFTLPLTAATEPACIMAGGCVRPDPIMPKEKSPPVEPLELAASAPDRHIVVPGDTLWGLAALFLKQPYRWPELWQLNRHEIKNPHRIYPGQVVYLDRSGATPRLRIGNPLEGNDASTVKLSPKVLATDNRSAIPAIPPKAIEPFLARPLVIEAGALDQAARIIATQEDRVVVGAGNTVYATGIGDTATVWQVYRPGRSLIDPENQQILGHEAFYLGAARLIRPGEPATLEILNSTQEIGLNDRLVPVPAPAIINYLPHAPDQPISSRVMSVYGALEEGASHAIITLSRGARDGLEVGHVLALSRAGTMVSNRFQDKKESYRLPDERYGLVFVFRVFDRVSYALVMNVSRPVIVGDTATTP